MKFEPMSYSDWEARITVMDKIKYISKKNSLGTDKYTSQSDML